MKGRLMIDYLSEKKTYILTALAVAILVLRNALGLEIPGVPADPEWIVHLLAFLGIVTTRAAIAKNGDGYDPWKSTLCALVRSTWLNQITLVKPRTQVQ